jgi:2-polyprenyl-3-methyl-5-hydroxy-6-metoxy-1,4-benzoquinol methylase
MKKENFSKFNIVCPICRGKENKFRKNISGYELFDCKKCGGEFSWPTKSLTDYNQPSEKKDFNKLLEKSLRRNFTYSSLATFLNLIKRGTILDIGAGPGTFIFHAHRLGFEPYAIDLSEGSLSGFSQNCPFSKFCQSSGEKFDMPKEWPKTFDVISALDVLEHAEDPFLTGQNIYNHLSQGGYFIGSLPNKNRYYYKFLKVIDDFVLKDCGGDNPPYHMTFWQKKTAKVYLESLGFEDYYIFSGGLAWRKNILIGGKRSAVLSSLVNNFYKNTSKIPLPAVNFVEQLGTHLIFFAKKGKGKDDMQKIGGIVEKKLYKKEIPFFIDGEIE